MPSTLIRIIQVKHMGLVCSRDAKTSLSTDTGLRLRRTGLQVAAFIHILAFHVLGSKKYTLNP